MAHKLVSADCRGARPHDVASDQMGKGKRVGQRYLAGALEVGGVGLDELVGVDILHRPRRGSRHPVAAAAARGRERERQVVWMRLLWGLGFGGGGRRIHIWRGSAIRRLRWGERLGLGLGIIWAAVSGPSLGREVTVSHLLNGPVCQNKSSEWPLALLFGS